MTVLGMTTTLLLDGRIHAPENPGATAMAVRDGNVLWLGADDAGRARYPSAEVVALDGALVTPAFVDAHVHATSTGLLLSGLDLTSCASLDQCLDAVRRFAAESAAPVLWGHGWDETRWPQRRPPTRAELDEAAGGRPVYLSRIDVHSALVTTPLAALANGVTGYDPDGPLSREAHHVVRGAAKGAVTPEQRGAAQRAFLQHAVARGVGCVHECAGPDISGVGDLHDLLSASGAPEVVGYWGELVDTADRAREVLAATRAHGLAGDLFCDGALGSRTAALHAPYADAPANRGARYLDAEQIAAHVAACTEAGVQAGFHVIGDAAVAEMVAGFELAEHRVGRPALAARTHRLEHLEMIDAGQAAALARWGVVASVQPQFDATWGGAAGMYAARLGEERAARMNPFALLSSTGMVLAFGSDTPVTPVDPWASVRAAVQHRTPGSGIQVTDALHAHTVGGHTAGRHAVGGTPTGAGTLTAGAPATYAVWDADSLESAVAGEGPRCLRTVVRGEVVFDHERALQT